MQIDERFIRVSIEELTTPKSGHVVIADSWWASKDGHVLGFKLYGPGSKERPTPQCNSDRRVAEKVICALYPGYEAVHIPVAYWQPHKD